MHWIDNNKPMMMMMMNTHRRNRLTVLSYGEQLMLMSDGCCEEAYFVKPVTLSKILSKRMIRSL